MTHARDNNIKSEVMMKITVCKIDYSQKTIVELLEALEVFDR